MVTSSKAPLFYSISIIGLYFLYVNFTEYGGIFLINTRSTADPAQRLISMINIITGQSGTGSSIAE